VILGLDKVFPQVMGSGCGACAQKRRQKTADPLTPLLRSSAQDDTLKPADETSGATLYRLVVWVVFNGLLISILD